MSSNRFSDDYSTECRQPVNALNQNKLLFWSSHIKATYYLCLLSLFLVIGFKKSIT